MAKTYRIIYSIDDTQARATTQRSVKGLESVEAAAKRAAAVQEREAKRLDSVQDRLVRSDYSRRVQYERQKVLAAERSAKQATTAQERAARQATATQEREAKRLDTIQDQFVKKDYSRRVQYEKKKLEESKQRDAFLGAAALAGIKVLADSYNAIRDDAMAAAEATLAMKQALRIEGTLKGLTPDQALKESLAFRARTGLDADAATAFVQGFKGSAPAGKTKGNITDTVSEELMVQAGITSARQGGDKKTRGELAGIISQFGKVNTVEEGLGEIEAIRAALESGRGDDSELTRQLLQVAGAIVDEGGVVKSLAEMGALVGVTSISAGEGRAGVRAEQLVRGLRVGLTKRHTKEGTDVGQADYLESLKISEADTLESTLEKLYPDLEQAEAAGRDLSVYLSGKNFNSEEERRAIVETYRNRDVLRTRMEAARQGRGKGAEIIKANEAFLRSDEGRKAKVGVAEDIQTVTRGAPGQTLAGLTGLAEQSEAVRSGDENMVTRTLDFYRGLMNFDFSDPRATGRATRVTGEVVRGLRGRAEALGVSPRELDVLDPTMPMGPKGPLAMQEFANTMKAMIEARGGNIDVDLKPMLEKMNVTLDKLNTNLDAPPRAPRALQAPVGGPVRPGQ